MKKFLYRVIPILLAVICWVVMNATGWDKEYFFYDLSSPVARQWKIVHLIYCIILFWVIGKGIEYWKIKWVRHAVLIALLYLVILSIGLVLVWPGTWAWDDMTMLSCSKTFSLNGWQNVVTWVVQVMELMTLPFATGIVIMQMICAAMITGYSIGIITEVFFTKVKKRWLVEAVLFLAFLMPPIFFFLYNGWRMSLYSFLELFLIVKLVTLKYQEKPIVFADYFSIVFSTILIASWRSEGIYYICLVPLFLLLFGRKRIGYIKVIICSIVIISATIAIGKVNTWIIGDSDYAMTATVVQITELVRAADPVEDAELLEELNRAIDVNVIYDNPDRVGESLFWNYGLIRETYTSEDYQAYMNAYVKMILRHPGTFLNERMQMFLSSMGVIVVDGQTMQRTSMQMTAELFSGGNPTGLEIWQSSGTKYGEPFSIELREKTIRFLACMNDDYSVNAGYWIFWNVLIPITALVLIFIYTVFRRKKLFLSLILFCVLCRVPLLFLTSPAPYFMYFMSVYLIGYFALAFFVMYLIAGKMKQTVQ